MYNRYSKDRTTNKAPTLRDPVDTINIIVITTVM